MPCSEGSISANSVGLIQFSNFHLRERGAICSFLKSLVPQEKSLATHRLLIVLVEFLFDYIFCILKEVLVLGRIIISIFEVELCLHSSGPS